MSNCRVIAASVIPDAIKVHIGQSLHLYASHFRNCQKPERAY